MATRFPSFNGIETELYGLRRGFGLGVQTIEKINNAPHLLYSLDAINVNGLTPVDHALAAREKLVDFISGIPLDDRELTALKYNLNFDDLSMRLVARQSDLEAVLKVGRRQRATFERNGFRVLTEKLYRAAKERDE